MLRLRMATRWLCPLSSHPTPPHPTLLSLQSYKPLMPKRGDQALWQGGLLIFEGPRLLWAHSDPGTAVHADLPTVLAVATQGRQA